MEKIKYAFEDGNWRSKERPRLEIFMWGSQNGDGIKSRVLDG